MHDFRIAADGRKKKAPHAFDHFPFFLLQNQFLNLTTVRHNGFFLRNETCFET